MKLAALAPLAALSILTGCGKTFTPVSYPQYLGSTISGELGPKSKIRHVVIIFQENRSVDNLFNGFPGADTVRSGENSKGKTVLLQPVPLTEKYDVSHEHDAFVVEDANGRLDGFNLVSTVCRKAKNCPPPGKRAYGFVPRATVKPYWDMAEQYTLADHMFQSNSGPSFPAHQYIISGTSTIADGSQLRAASNALAPLGGFTGGCDSPTGSFVLLIDPFGNENQSTYPCFERRTLMDLLQKKSLGWRYYVAKVKPGLWNGPDAIEHIRNSKEYASHVLAPPSTVLRNISSGSLAAVVWVTPTAAESDHAGTNDGTGPSWVASVVNAVGKSKYWNDTAIFVTWDDWGGWYDHVRPPQFNSYELGFRVPLIVISPYAKAHYVSHRRHEFGSILKFVEETFGLDSLHTTDMRADNLSDCFDFSKAPMKFKPIAAPHSAGYFLRQPLSSENPDDD